MSQKVVIVNYGMGNILSVKRKLDRIGVDAIISSEQSTIATADKIILPGVGHFGRAMKNLHGLDLIDLLNDMVVNRQKPVLGICLGMQLMAQISEEGNTEGLAWFDAEVVRFNVKDKLLYKVPQVGWNQIKIEKDSELMRNIPESSEFYFVHSYHIKCNNAMDILNTTSYEYPFVSAIQRDNIFGVQYHPEKSHDVGNILLQNFVNVSA